MAVGRAAGMSLRINLNDGRSETYSLDEHPRISFDESNMLVGSDKLSTSYSRSFVLRLRGKRRERVSQN